MLVLTRGMLSRQSPLRTDENSIVVCHGLYSKYRKTSDHPSETTDLSTKWLEDLLLDNIKDSRVMVFDFNYDAKGFKVMSREGCEKAAAELLFELCGEEGTPGQVCSSSITCPDEAYLSFGG